MFQLLQLSRDIYSILFSYWIGFLPCIFIKCCKSKVESFICFCFYKRDEQNHIENINEGHMLLTQSAQNSGGDFMNKWAFTQTSMRLQGHKKQKKNQRRVKRTTWGNCLQTIEPHTSESIHQDAGLWWNFNWKEFRSWPQTQLDADCSTSNRSTRWNASVPGTEPCLFCGTRGADPKWSLVIQRPSNPSFLHGGARFCGRVTIETIQARHYSSNSSQFSLLGGNKL